MKRIYFYQRRTCLAVLLFLTTSFRVSAQELPCPVVEITFNKTSSLVFERSIMAVDRGSRDLLVQKVDGAQNILYLKAARPAFAETNLTVITADGAIRQFTVTYANSPREMITYVSGSRTPENLHSVAFDDPAMHDELEVRAAQIMKSKKKRHLKTYRDAGIRLSLKSISIHDNHLFFKVRLANSSSIEFDTDVMRFYVKDKKQVRRTAAQEKELAPVLVTGKADVIPGNDAEDLVWVLEKFTIPNEKRLIIELFERNGGRRLALSIPSRLLIRAKPL